MTMRTKNGEISKLMLPAGSNFKYPGLSKTSMDLSCTTTTLHLTDHLQPYIWLLKVMGYYPWTNSKKSGKSTLSPTFFTLTVVHIILQILSFAHCFYLFMSTLSQDHSEHKSLNGIQVLSTCVYILASLGTLPLLAWKTQKFADKLEKFSFLTALSAITGEERLLTVIRYTSWLLLLLIGGTSLATWALCTLRPMEKQLTFFGWKFTGMAKTWPYHLLLGPVAVAIFSRGVTLVCFLSTVAVFGARFGSTWKALLHYKLQYEMAYLDTNEWNDQVQKVTSFHFNLSEAVQSMDAIFGPATLLLSTSDMFSFVSLLSSLIDGALSSSGFVHLVYGMDATSNFLMLLCTGGTFMYLVLRASVAAYLHHEAHEVAVIIHSCLESLTMDKQSLKRLKTTLRRLRDAPVGFTGWGLFLIDTKFILTVSGLVITYIFVILEMNEGKQNDYSHIKLHNNLSLQ